MSKDDYSNYSNFLDESKKHFYAQFGVPNDKYKCDLKDFELLYKLGAGAFGKVVLVRHIEHGSLHAMKVIKKAHVLKSKQLDHTLNEQRILQTCKHPNLMRMEYFYMDNGSLYFILPFLNGGDLYAFLNKYKRFDESITKFYTAQVFLGLEYLHFLNVIYRDLKPENIMLDWMGYIKLTDFGFCKVLNKGRTYTICGTPEYIAPELVMMKGYGLSSDWWSFGILLFELTAGYVPFKDTGDHVRLYNQIVSGKYKMHSGFSKDLKDLIHNVLQVDITKRLGCLKRGPKEIKEHAFFSEIPWIYLFNKKVVPPIKPPVKDAMDITPYENEEMVRLSTEPEVNRFEKEFADF